jgi:hypothetical protein
MHTLRGRGSITPYSFMTSALDGDEWSASRPSHALSPGKDPGQEAGWVPELIWTQRLRGKTLCSCRGSNPGHPVCIRTLYWLRYPSSRLYSNWTIYKRSEAFTVTECDVFVGYQLWQVTKVQVSLWNVGNYPLWHKLPEKKTMCNLCATSVVKNKYK